MAPRRIRHEKIQNFSTRNGTFGRRTRGIEKKAKELATLCGVEVGVVIQKPQEDEEGSSNNQGTSIELPSTMELNVTLDRFTRFIPMERDKKMVTNETFMEKLITHETQAVAKVKERLHIKEAHLLMKQLSLGKSISEFNRDQLKCLSLFSATMLEQLEKREADLKNEQLHQHHDPESHSTVSPNTVAFLDDVDLEYHQFMEEKANKISRGEKAPEP